MQCPNCHSPLKQVDYEGILIETCESCEGEFLDDQELRHVTQARERKYDEETRRGLAKATKIQGVALAKVDRKRTCPKCGGATSAVNYGGDTGIIIDRCQQCRGIWLDGGELEKIEMLVEGWEDELPNDLKRYGLQLKAAEEKTEREFRRRGRGGYRTFADSLIYGMFTFP
jgi:Zn-finger nucleic acid-binding protein